MKRKISFFQLFIYLFLGLLTLTILIPSLNIVAQSLTDPTRMWQLKGYHILPKGFTFLNYEVVLGNASIWRSVFNSITITVVGTGINILLTASAAYVLTRPGLVGKKILMILLIVIMICDPGIIQEYFVVRQIKLLDNIWSMILYKSVNVYYLIILMRFFSEIPAAVIESATIDGAGELSILFKIVMPLGKIPLLTVGMFYAVTRWNEFFKSSVFLTSKDNTVLQVLLRQFIVKSDSQVMVGAANLFKNNVVAQLNFTSIKAATIVIAVAPILLLYPLILKHYTGGVISGAVKE